MTTPTRLTVSEVADELRCSERHVNDEIRRLNLRATKVGGRWLIDPDDISAYVDAKANVSRVRRAS